jgi:hypothetical protein
VTSNPAVIRRVAAAVLHRAVSDAQGIEYERCEEAIAWLASQAAEPYFALVEMPQSTFLLRAGWLDWVDNIPLAWWAANPTVGRRLSQSYNHLASLQREN